MGHVYQSSNSYSVLNTYRGRAGRLAAISYPEGVAL